MMRLSMSNGGLKSYIVANINIYYKISYKVEMTRPTINRKLYITSIDVKRKMYMLFQEMKFEGAILNDPEIKELFEGDMQIKNIHKHTTFFREGHTGKILIAIGIIYRAL